MRTIAAKTRWMMLSIFAYFLITGWWQWNGLGEKWEAQRSDRETLWRVNGLGAEIGTGNLSHATSKDLEFVVKDTQAAAKFFVGLIGIVLTDIAVSLAKKNAPP